MHIQSDWQTTQPTPHALGLVPMVVEQSGRGERAYDIYSPAQRAHCVYGGAGDR